MPPTRGPLPRGPRPKRNLPRPPGGRCSRGSTAKPRRSCQSFSAATIGRFARPWASPLDWPPRFAPTATTAARPGPAGWKSCTAWPHRCPLPSAPPTPIWQPPGMRAFCKGTRLRNWPVAGSRRAAWHRSLRAGWAGHHPPPPKPQQTSGGWNSPPIAPWFAGSPMGKCVCTCAWPSSPTARTPIRRSRSTWRMSRAKPPRAGCWPGSALRRPTRWTMNPAQGEG